MMTDLSVKMEDEADQDQPGFCSFSEDLPLVKSELTPSSDIQDPIRVDPNDIGIKIELYSGNDEDMALHCQTADHLPYNSSAASTNAKDESDIRQGGESENHSIVSEPVASHNHLHHSQSQGETSCPCSSQAKEPVIKDEPEFLINVEIKAESMAGDELITADYDPLALRISIQDDLQGDITTPSSSYTSQSHQPAIKKKSGFLHYLPDGSPTSSDSDRLKGSLSTKPYACSMCDYRTGQRNYIKKHMRIHTGEKPYACDMCDYRSEWRYDINKHMRIHTGEKPYACDTCDFRTAHQRYIKKHMRNHVGTHTGEKPYACSMCDFRTRQRGYIKRHMRSHTGEKPFTCDMCDFKTKWHHSLKLHMMTHTGEKPYGCDMCDYKTRQLKYIKKHMIIHTQEKHYTCDMCDYSTGEQSNIKRHRKSHFKNCKMCDFNAERDYDLESHVKKCHTKKIEKPYACDICDHRASTLSYLRTHMRKVHTGEDPHACDVCHYRTRKLSDLKSHVRKTHTEQMMYTCDMCGYRVGQLNHLKNHQKFHSWRQKVNLWKLEIEKKIQIPSEPDLIGFVS